MTAIATIDWNAKVKEALERADIMACLAMVRFG
jgi:hypothetical protein